MDTDPLLRMDPQKRAEVWGKMGSDGLATPNEGRRRFNLRPLEGGDTVYKQMQDLPLAEAAKNTVQPKEAPAPEPDPDPEPTEEDQERAIITAINKAFERAAA
jgi:hypothetical protein